VKTTDELDDDALMRASERHCLQLAFMTHQCRRRLAARGRDVERLLREKEEITKSHERLLSDYHSVQKKSGRRKAALERIRQEHDMAKKQLEELEGIRANEAVERADLEKKLQDSV
jgi:chromosome segregation ATPase